MHRGWRVFFNVSFVAVAALSAVAVGLLVSPGLRRDYRLEAFVAADSPVYRSFQRFLSEFASNEFALIAVQTDDALSEPSQEIIRGLVDRCRRIPAVQQVSAVTEIPGIVRRLLGSGLRTHPLIVDNLISRDGRTAAILMQMAGESPESGDRRDNVARLREIVTQARQQHPDAVFYLAGPYVTHIDMYEYVDRDLLHFSIAAFALLTVTLWLVFGRARPAVYAIGAGLAALACTLGLAALLHVNVSLIVQMMVILITVLTVASCVHLAIGMEESAAARPDRTITEHAVVALRRLAAPCIGVIVTTAAAFGSVSVSNITPVRVFGLLMMFGLLIGLVFSFVLLPLAGVPEAGRLSRRGHRVQWALASVAFWSLRRKRTVLLIFAAATLVAVVGVPRIAFESDFIKSFRPASTVRTSYEFIERNLSPLGSLEVVVRTRDGTQAVTPESLATALRLAEQIRADYPMIRKVMTPADVLTLSGEGLPGNRVSLSVRLEAARTLLGEEALRNFINAAGTAMRLNLRAAEGYDVEEKLRVTRAIEQDARAAFGDACDTHVTGLYYFHAQLVSGLVRDQYRSFLVTVPLVMVSLILVFRSLRLGVIAIVPNLLPVLYCLGTMAWLGIPMSTTTVMMISVTLGIAVDHALHYLWRCRAEYAELRDYGRAIGMTHASAGRACLFTTVVIAGGFWILTLSEFLPTAYFGGLLGFTMMCALAADLLLLPVMLQRFRPYRAPAVRAEVRATVGAAGGEAAR